MTTYRLRDRELQQKLDEISGGCFTEALESIKKPSCIVFQARNGGPAMSVNLTKQDIEQFLEYNPNDWNVFPDVTPPEGVLMLVECIDEDDKTFKTCAEYVGDGYGAYYWRNEYEIDVPVKRFRPLE